MLSIAAPVYDAMLDHARQEAPNECCGLLAGRSGVADWLYRLGNALGSPTAYEADVGELFAAFRDIRFRGLELIAIYHSHPRSAPLPSRADLEQNYYGDLPRVIISLAEERPVVRAFRLFESGYEEVVCRRVEAAGPRAEN